MNMASASKQEKMSSILPYRIAVWITVVFAGSGILERVFSTSMSISNALLASIGIVVAEWLLTRFLAYNRYVASLLVVGTWLLLVADVISNRLPDVLVAGWRIGIPGSAWGALALIDKESTIISLLSFVWLIFLVIWIAYIAGWKLEIVFWAYYVLVPNPILMVVSHAYRDYPLTTESYFHFMTRALSGIGLLVFLVLIGLITEYVRFRRNGKEEPDFVRWGLAGWACIKHGILRLFGLLRAPITFPPD